MKIVGSRALALRLGISQRRAQAMLQSGRFKGVRRFMGVWSIRVDDDGLPEVVPSKMGPKTGTANALLQKQRSAQ